MTETVILIILAAYFLICAGLFFTMRALWRRRKVPLRAPRSRVLYYLISFTWGLPVTLGGCLTAAVLMLFGKRPHRYGWDWCFEFNVDWGLDCGLFFICGHNPSERLKMHEHGHSVQNLYFGIFMPFVVCLPSTLRFQWREFMYRHGKTPRTGYDDAWFEGQATVSGAALTNRINAAAKERIEANRPSDDSPHQ